MDLQAVVDSEVFGYLALLIQVITFSRANDRHLILFQILFLLCLSLQFYAYDLMVACGVAILSIVRNSVQLIWPASAWRHVIFAGFLLTPAIVFMTDANPAQLIACATWIFASIGILYLSGHAKTGSMATAASIHMVFGIVIGSTPIILIEIVTLSSLALRTWSIYKSRTN